MWELLELFGIWASVRGNLFLEVLSGAVEIQSYFDPQMAIYY